MLELRRAVVFTVSTLLLFGGAYHGVLWSLGRLAFPEAAEGSLVHRADGTVIGSRLVAQRFTRDGYVHPRPSAGGYDAASSGGSNLAASNPDQRRLVRQRLDAVMRREGVSAAAVPSELVTASASGLDPHVSPAGVAIQIARVARARHIGEAQVRAVVAAHTEPPLWGLFGGARINVLDLNVALDHAFGAAPRSGRP